jgi:acetoacetyl-CoA synthetase
MYDFMASVNQKHGLQLTHYDELHKWSTSHIDKFWGRVWEYVGVRAERQASKVCTVIPIPRQEALKRTQLS